MNHFIKQNPLPGTNTLECEKAGLDELKLHQARHKLNIPHVVSIDSHQLILEKIESVAPNESHWRALGEGLYRLHQIEVNPFGYAQDNFIGLNPQKNTPAEDWGEFFYQYRLLFQVDLILNSELRAQLREALSSHKTRLIEFLNSHEPRPSIVHGDLWSGNVMFSAKGPWLIDPAIYYGDFEVDLAMTKLFGGFSQEFYNEYFKNSPKTDGFETREVIYNLYHYLNHYNLFGHSYLASVMNGIELIKGL